MSGPSHYTVGTDRVQRIGVVLTVVSPCDMEDWQVRDYRRMAIWIDGVRYAVGARARGGGGTIRYRLDPWPADSSDPPGTEIHYNLTYVEERDRLNGVQRRRAFFSGLLLPIQPLVGFLWFPTKERLQLSLGIEPRRATGQSLFLQYLALLALMALILIVTYSQLDLSGGWLVGSLLVLVPDAIIRWSLLNDGYPAGFGEWLVRRRRP